jgi:hypothetical protein
MPAIVQFELVDEIAEFLANHPTDEEILAYRVPDRVQERASELLQFNRSRGLTDSESAEMDRFEMLEHFFIMLKAKTRMRIAGK